jgi:hypothetical protein
MADAGFAGRLGPPRRVGSGRTECDNGTDHIDGDAVDAARNSRTRRLAAACRAGRWCRGRDGADAVRADAARIGSRHGAHRHVSGSRE